MDVASPQDDLPTIGHHDHLALREAPAQHPLGFGVSGGAKGRAHNAASGRRIAVAGNVEIGVGCGKPLTGLTAQSRRKLRSFCDEYSKKGSH